MPITPFHFGPGALIHTLAPKKVSFLAFCAANVVIDIESLSNLLLGNWPIHTFLHTYIGASVATVLTVGGWLLARHVARTYRLPNPAQWQSLTVVPTTIGSALGAYSHVLIDSVMHSDAVPLAPFIAHNAMHGYISIEALHLVCVASGGLGLIVLGLRRWRRGNIAD
ncbi:MAG: hypothetical protein QM520_01815 [Gammaproteobacteria bacterium]|nr:hypothetical protein [Gammaproteobacteria bacterium]